jgi:hypothetical protein
MTPPGIKHLGTIRDELGAVQLCDQVFSGNLQEFFLSPNGHIEMCANKLWSSDRGEVAQRDTHGPETVGFQVLSLRQMMFFIIVFEEK